VSAPEIKTSNTYPPIPVRQFDWCAWYDGEEEAGPYGWGATEQAAIDDLVENYHQDDSERSPDSQFGVGA
jgi:hypothetical protein